FLFPAAGGEVLILAGEVGVFGVAGRLRRFGQGSAEPHVTFAGLTALALAGALVVARTDAYPGCEVRRTGKACDVSPDLGQNDLDRAQAHARDPIESLDLVLKRAQPLGDLLAQLIDQLVQPVKVSELVCDQEALVRSDAAGQ